MIAENPEDSQNFVTHINSKSEPYVLEINIRKTQIMAINREEQKSFVNVNINGKTLEQVPRIRYLGHLITDDGKCEMEMNALSTE